MVKKLIKIRHITIKIRFSALYLVQIWRLLLKKPMLKPLLVLMTRWPAANRCKTRLAKQIGGFQAAKIQKKLISHTIEVSKGLEESGSIDIKLAVDGIGKKKIISWAKNNCIQKACSQGRGNLGVRMKKQIISSQRSRRKITNRARDVIIIGTDLVNICPAEIELAFSSLNKDKLVIGPSEDGGYWLIGFSKDIINPQMYWPFSGIKWGSDSVLKETIARARLRDIKYKLIHKKNDIDIISDLIEWQK